MRVGYNKRAPGLTAPRATRAIALVSITWSGTSPPTPSNRHPPCITMVRMRLYGVSSVESGAILEVRALVYTKNV